MGYMYPKKLNKNNPLCVSVGIEVAIVAHLRSNIRGLYKLSYNIYYDNNREDNECIIVYIFGQKAG